jgi:hypothetical protein
MADKKTLESRLDELEEELSRTKDNKATNKHLAVLRSKVAQTRRDVIKASKRVHGKGFFVRKSGDATVALVGFPSAGKSSLLNALTNSSSKTAPYAFTTTGIIPGTMVYRDAHIQVLDMPGLIENAHAGVGEGTSVVAQIRVSNLIVFVIDINNIAQLDMLLSELGSLNVYVNKEKPEVQVREVDAYIGLRFEVNRSGMDTEELRTIFTGFGIYNAVVRIWNKVGEDELIGLLSNRSCYVSAIIALNKIDTNDGFASIAESMEKRYGMSVLPISALSKPTLDMLTRSIYANAGLMRVYLKPRSGKERSPVTAVEGFTVGELAKRFHTAVVDELKCAYVDGPSVKFSNQRVGVNHVLKDGDTVTFIKEK